MWHKTIQEADFNISFCPRGYGWTIAKVSINGEETELSITYGGNRDGQVNALVKSLHHLSSLVDNMEFVSLVEYVDDVKGFDCNGNPIGEENKDDEVTWGLVPKSARFIWDEEGQDSEWVFEREPRPTQEIDFDMNVIIHIRHGKTKIYKFGIRYQKMCFIVARACMEMIKKHGLYYYFRSSAEDLNLRSLMFIKAIAMNRMDVFDIKKLDNEDDWASSFEDEIAFLVEEMPAEFISASQV